MKRDFLSAIPRVRPKEQHVFLAVTIVTGIVTGLSAVLFALCVEETTRLTLGLRPAWWRMLAVPVGLSLVTGLLLARYFADARGSGIPQTKAAYRLRHGVIPLRVPLGKFLTGVLSIGSGLSLGREGPSVQVGAGLASAIAQWLRLPAARVRSLMAVGAAGALAAAFNTPVAAVLFALEEIMGDLNAALVGSTVIASVAAVMVSRSIVGNAPLFRVPTYEIANPTELVFYALLGILGGVISLVFTKSLLGLRARFKRLPRRTLIVQPAAGALLNGIILIGVPQVLGGGYQFVDQALNGGLPLQLLLLLGAAKLLATVLAYSSGNAGGIFAPTLFMGAMVGGLVGDLVNRFAPFPTADVGAYALVGMGALFAGIIRAPMTSVLMIFELTQDYQILVPLMVTNLLSFFISQRYQPTPIYDALLEQDGIVLAPAKEPDFRQVRAHDVMSRGLPVVPETQTAAEVLASLPTPAPAIVLVGTPERTVGVVGLEDLVRAVDADGGERPIIGLVRPAGPDVFADDPLDLVVGRLRESPGILTVVSRGRHRHVEGVVTADSIAGYLRPPNT